MCVRLGRARARRVHGARLNRDPNVWWDRPILMNEENLCYRSPEPLKVQWFHASVDIARKQEHHGM